MLLAQSCLTLCDPMDCSLPGCSVLGILQARILERVAIPFSSRFYPLLTFFKNCFYSFIWLHWVLVAACGIFSCGTQTLSCGMWDLVPWPGIKPGAPCIGSSEPQPRDHQGRSPWMAFFIKMYPTPSPLGSLAWLFVQWQFSKFTCSTLGAQQKYMKTRFFCES